MNLTDELEKSFVDEPPHRPVEQRITAGRRLVRRRRAVTGAAALAVVAVLGAGYAAIGDDDQQATDPPIADQTDDLLTEMQLEDREQLDEWKVFVDQGGQLLTAEGVEVLLKDRNPDGYGPPGTTWGVVFMYAGTTRWALIDPSGGAYEDAFQSFPSFEYWLADQIALQQGDPTLALVEFGQGEQLLPRAGVEILQQTGDVDLGPNFAGPNDRTAVAEVTYSGERWYVLARDVDGDIQYFPTAASVSKPTLEKFLPFAKQSYEGGAGLR